MYLIVFYSLLLLSGIVVSQTVNFDQARELLPLLTTVCLAYIMVEVGLEFTIQKDKLKHYAWDFCVATIAAVLPWLLCAAYFGTVFHLNWKESGLVGLFAAPTSAGVLFAMLTAAGLGMTWVFKQARILAIFDDIATILLLIPLQIVLVGMKMEMLFVVVIIIFLLAGAYRWLNCLRVPVGKLWLFFYSVILVVFLKFFNATAHIHLEVLLPAFTLGCVLFNPPAKPFDEAFMHELSHMEPLRGWPLWFDRLLKGGFMFLVGCSLPKIDLGLITPMAALWHVLMLTLLSNLGKCFILCCYRREASLISRLALSVAMFPRGEVGAGVLLIAISHGFGGAAASLGVLSLALNLLLTGGFIAVVVKLISEPASS